MGSLALTLPRLGTTTSQEINQGVIASGGVAAGVLSSIASGAIATGLLTAATASAIIPFVGPIIAGVTLLVSALGVGDGCGVTCTETTQIVNKIEPIMQQNLAAAQQQAVANGGCLTLAEQQVAVSNFNQLWGNVVAGCQQVGGQGGSQCVADRQPGGKYNWTSYYLTPIMQIPVCPQTAGLSGIVAGISTGFGISSDLLLPIALIVAGLLLSGSN